MSHVNLSFFFLSFFSLFLTFSGAVEDSVSNMVMKAPSPPMATGRTGLPGPLAPGPAEEGCLTETACAPIPSEHTCTSALPSHEHFLSCEPSQQHPYGNTDLYVT